MTKTKARGPAAHKATSGLKGYVDLIAPGAIRHRGHSTYLICGNTYRSIWAIRDYPRKVPPDSHSVAMLRELGESDGVTLHIYGREMSPSEQTQIMEAAQRRNRYRTSDHKVTTATQAEQNMLDIKDLSVRTHKRREKFMHCAVFIEILAYSLEDLKARQAEIAARLNLHRILVDKLNARQKEGLSAVLPGGRNVFGIEFERALPASSVANLFPLSYSGKTDPHGFYIGRDENGSNIIADFDQRDPDKTNGHVLALGNSGEGKSYLFKLLSENVVIAGKSLFLLDIENEYADLTRNLGGTNLDMLSGDYCINVLEPRLWTDNTAQDDQDEEAPAAFRMTGRLSQHIAFLRDFFKTYRSFDEDELDVLEIMLEETYRQFRIDNETDFSRLTANHFPILSDLYRTIELKLSTYEEEVEAAAAVGHPIMYTKALLQKVGLGIRNISVGANSRYFNGKTNIPNARLINFIVKDLQNTNDNLKNAMFLNIFSYMSHQFLTLGRCTLVVDELHEFVKNRTAISYLSSFMKRGRKKDSNVFVGSQNVEDLLHPDVIHYTKPLLMIPTHSFLFFPGNNCSPAEYQKALNVLPHEFSVIEMPNRGHCLYKCGNERYHLHVIAPEHKRRLFGEAGGR